MREGGFLLEWEKGASLTLMQNTTSNFTDKKNKANNFDEGAFQITGQV